MGFLLLIWFAFGCFNYICFKRDYENRHVKWNNTTRLLALSPSFISGPIVTILIFWLSYRD